MIIATWNINSIRLRINKVLKFVKENNIDVLCLQETKTLDADFPLSNFKDTGLVYHHIRGEKSYNGVAILSRIPILVKSHINWCSNEDSRHLFVKLNNGISLHNFYVPAGGDIPDVKKNKKFKHKIIFLKEMIQFFKKDSTNLKIILGDLNIAPSEHDVWSHKQLINVVSHTPTEIKHMSDLIRIGKLYDVIREKNPIDKKLYSWWSYRSKDWKKSDRGRRLDHILISKDLINISKNVMLHKAQRGTDKPSDHIPVTLEIDK